MGKTVFVFGNPLVEQDSVALRVAERLRGKVQGIEFRAVESLEETGKGEDLYIMDAVEGIGKVQVIEGIEGLEASQPVSLHDFDLAMELKLLRKLGKLGKVKVIAIPAACNPEKAAGEVEGLLKSIFPSS